MKTRYFCHRKYTKIWAPSLFFFDGGLHNPFLMAAINTWVSLFFLGVIPTSPRHPNNSWEDIWNTKTYLKHPLSRYLDVYGKWKHPTQTPQRENLRFNRTSCQVQSLQGHLKQRGELLSSVVSWFFVKLCWVGQPPAQDAGSSPPGWHYNFRIGNPELNLHVWRLQPGSWEYPYSIYLHLFVKLG